MCLIMPSVQAQFFEVSVEPDNVTVHSGTSVSFDVLIDNKGDSDEVFTISASGEKLLWRNPTYLLVTIPARSNKTITENYHVPDADSGEYEFSVHVKSFFHEVEHSESFVIEVLPPFYLISLNADEGDEKVMATLELDISEERELDIVFEIIDEVGDIITSVSTKERVEGMSVIETAIPFQLSHPGAYILKVTVMGEVMESSFNVEEISMLEEAKERVSTLFYDEVVITLTNTGNVPATYKTEEIAVPGDLVTGLVSAPKSCIISGNAQLCSYEIQILPGETKEIRYRVEFWPSFARIGAGLLVILVIGIVTASRYSKPRISKKYRRGRKATSIVLGVKSPFSHTRSVMVRDWVSPLARVVMEGFEGTKPVVRRSDAGTELIWKLGDMSPGEERLLGYKIRPRVAGNLKMPRATMRYKRSSGTSVRKRSNHVSIR